MRSLVLVAWLLVLGSVAPALAAGNAVQLQDPRTGRTVTLEPGAPVLHLVFFATWCPVCVDELPRLGELAARWSGRGYRQVLVAVRARHSSERLARFFDGRPLPGELLFDGEGAAEQAWGARQVPAHLVLDASGRELVRSGALNREVEAAIERAVAAADQRRGGGRKR